MSSEYHKCLLYKSMELFNTLKLSMNFILFIFFIILIFIVCHNDAEIIKHIDQHKVVQGN